MSDETSDPKPNPEAKPEPSEPQEEVADLSGFFQWFEDHPDARPKDLPEQYSLFMRLCRNGQVTVPADFLAKFYLIHLKQTNRPLPSGPAGYDVEFVENASDFFDCVATRCLYAYLKKDGMVLFDDPDVPLMASDPGKELKIEMTDKGKAFFEDFEKRIKEAYEKASKDQIQPEEKK